MTLKVNEIYTSLSGEPDGFNCQGCMATFVRLQGCNLKCKWCDTKYAGNFDDWKEMHIAAVVEQCTTRHVIITGGEPLLQIEDVDLLVNTLIKRYREREKHHFITIETNGTMPITINEARIRYNFLRFVVDYKLCSSGMRHAMIPEIFAKLYPLDIIKFVIADLNDYRQAKELVWRNPKWLAKKVFSPVIPGMQPRSLAEAMLKDKLDNVKLSLQLHKLLKLK